MTVADITEALESRALAEAEEAGLFTVRDQASYELAADRLLAIKDLMRAADAAFDPIIAQAFATHKKAIAQKAQITAPLAMSERAYKRAMSVYIDEQDRIGRAEEARLRAIAAEREALAKEAEIEAAEEQGATQAEVASIISRPAMIPPVTLASAVRRVAGIAPTKTWKFQVMDAAALAAYVVNTNRALIGLIEANEQAIGAMVRATKGTINLPGIKIWQESGISAGRK